MSMTVHLASRGQPRLPAQFPRARADLRVGARLAAWPSGARRLRAGLRRRQRAGRAGRADARGRRRAARAAGRRAGGGRRSVAVRRPVRRPLPDRPACSVAAAWARSIAPSDADAGTRGGAQGATARSRRPADESLDDSPGALQARSAGAGLTEPPEHRRPSTGSKTPMACARSILELVDGPTLARSRPGRRRAAARRGDRHRPDRSRVASRRRTSTASSIAT